MANIESVSHETRVFEPPREFAAQANVTKAQFDQMNAIAAKDYSGFWAKLAQGELLWHKPFTKSLDESNAPFYKWFEDGELNVSYNCLDRNLENGNAEKIAIIFEADDGAVTRVTYRELYHRVCRFANGLKSLGIKKGDRVIVYMPMSIEGVVAMQACARIGATHSVVFGGFSAKSLHERIIDAGASAVITADEQVRGGKHLPLKAIVDEALGLGGCEAVGSVIVYQRTGGKIAFSAPRDVWMHELAAKQADTCAPEWVGAEHPLFILYTSGSTGTPKGVQHSSGGYLLWAILTMKWTFDIKPADIFWCTADIGWVTGHTYIAYGPLAVGATEIVFEGIPTFPDAGRFWQTIQKHKCSIFYTAPTAIRSLIKACDANPQTAPKNYDLSSLRLLGTVGEPINPEAWMWYHNNVGGGRCPIVDTFWQTETGGHMITPLPGVTPLVPGSCTLPLPGIMAAIVDEAGHDVPNGQGGILVVKRPWPAMIRTIWGDPERYQEVVLPRGTGRQALSCRRRLGARQDHRLFHDHGPHRRRAQRLRASHGHDGNRVGAGGQSDRGRGGGRRSARRPDGRGDMRVRRAEAGAAHRRGGGEDREATARLGRQGDRTDRQAEGHPLRRQSAEDAIGKNHATAAAIGRQGREHHAGHVHARESGDSRTAQAGVVGPILPAG